MCDIFIINRPGVTSNFRRNETKSRRTLFRAKKMTFICCSLAKSPPRRLRKKLQCGPKSARSNGNVDHDISPAILTDDHRDDLIPSLFERIFVERGEERTNGRHGRARKKRRFVEVATGRNGLKRKIHPRLPKNVRAINSCRNPAVSLAGSTCCRDAQGIAPNQF